MPVDVTLPPGRAQLVRELLLRSREVFLDRIAELEDAALSLLTAGPLPEEQRSAGARTAHQLVSLATFGVAQAAVLAARAEALLADPGPDAGAAGAQLAEIALCLRDELEQALLAAPAAALPEPVVLPAPAGLDVLIVEDDVLLVELLSRALQGQGWTVRSVSDGAAALAAVDRPGTRPALVLLDIDLPALDGFGVLRGLAARGLLPDLPVLVLTARAGEPDIVAALELGARDHVAKPFSLPVLLARVARTVPRG